MEDSKEHGGAVLRHVLYCNRHRRVKSHSHILKLSIICFIYRIVVAVVHSLVPATGHVDLQASWRFFFPFERKIHVRTCACTNETSRYVVGRSIKTIPAAICHGRGRTSTLQVLVNDD